MSNSTVYSLNQVRLSPASSSTMPPPVLPSSLYGTSEHLFPANPRAVRHTAPPTAADGVTMGYRVVAGSVSIPPVRRLSSGFSSTTLQQLSLCDEVRGRNQFLDCPSIISNNSEWSCARFAPLDAVSAHQDCCCLLEMWNNSCVHALFIKTNNIWSNTWHTADRWRHKIYKL